MRIERNYCQLKNLLIVNQILLVLVSTIGNVHLSFTDFSTTGHCSK